MYNPYMWIYNHETDQMIIVNENWMLMCFTLLYHWVCVYINPFIGWIF
jgi:hypothetical protein